MKLLNSDKKDRIDFVYFQLCDLKKHLKESTKQQPLNFNDGDTYTIEDCIDDAIHNLEQIGE